MELGNESQKDEEELKFIRTNTVNQHLRNLARAVLLRKYPILLQGPTSSGKTSLVAFLAARTGHRFIRINNHEQTDLQEYLGTYIADENGQLTFQEGILVQAVRHGYWVVLDELNLAPTEVLEALNRQEFTLCLFYLFFALSESAANLVIPLSPDIMLQTFR